MNKGIIVCVFLLLVGFFTETKAQTELKSYVLNWGDVKTERGFDEQEIRYLNFDGAIYSPSAHWLPYFTTTVPLGVSVIGRANLENPKYSTLTREEVQLIRDKERLGSNVEVEQYQSVTRKRNELEIYFIPIRRNPSTGLYEKLVSFDLRITKVQEASKRSASSLNYRVNSVLKSGEWYKVGVTEDGIYRLTYADLMNLGMQTPISSGDFRMFGNGGGMLPMENDEPRPDDLQEIAIEVVDGGDGSIDQGDYVLFYGQGQHRWELLGSQYKHVTNYMADTTYYFITTNFSIGLPKRITTENFTGSPQLTLREYDTYAYHELDRSNLIKSGRQWFGESFSIQKEYIIPMSLENRIPGSSLFVRGASASRALTGASSFTFSVNDRRVFDIAFSSGVTPGYANEFAKVGSNEGSIAIQGGALSVKVTFNNPSTSDNGWLDYVELVGRGNLNVGSGQLIFRAKESAGNSIRYILSGATSATAVWKVTNHGDVKRMSATLNGSELRFNTSATPEVDEFVAFNSSSGFKTASLLGRVVNQDLHGLTQADYIMVVHPKFLSQANELADFHRSTYNYKVHVVTTQQVYNEFSGGNQDITAIKTFVKMFYDRAGFDETKMPDYLLLFGDASYDYKYRISGNTNYVPAYQSVNSTQPTRSYISDDYFGFLDDSESDALTSSLDIGIGRFPVRSVQEANNVVRKIKRYHERPDVLNPWRSWLAFVGDDEDARIHMRDCDDLAKNVQNNHPIYNLNKIYFDAYPQLTTAAGDRYPQVNEAITDAVTRGSLIVTYVGHGGETGWGHERVLTVPEINAWSNDDRYSLFLTATCEFSRFDDPQRTSGGEFTFLNPDGGGIALLTTTRLVYSSPNKELADTFFDHVFNKVNGEYPTLGDLLKLSKDPNNINNANGVNYRNFALLGDPGIRLAYPDYQVMTTSVPDTLKALEKVTITGYVADANGQKLSSFNGLVYPTVFDSPREIETLNNDNAGAFKFSTQTSPVFRGKASVTNGEFSFTFVVPKDIRFEAGVGRISYYAENGSLDAMGYDDQFFIGGRADSVAQDNRGPDVNLWMNNEQFVIGGITDESPVLLAKVFDENGINTVGNGIGHDIVAVLDENTANAIVLNDYYESETDAYQRGEIRYPFSELEEGKHTLSLKVWDVYNNSGEANTEFVVANSADFAIKNVLNYPNPFTTNTEFHFDHNAQDQALGIRIQIFTVAGKLVKTIDANYLSDGYHVGPIRWNGLDDYGDNIGRGTYVYRVEVTAPSGAKVTEYEKLVILM